MITSSQALTRLLPMTFYEMQLLSEDLLILSQPAISILSFHTPNFRTMSSILHALIKIYLPSFPNLTLHNEIQRVDFVKKAVESVPHLQLNTRNLYRSDSSCVRELLKLSRLLVQARQTVKSKDASITKIIGLKDCRLLATTITERGAELYEILAIETAGRVLINLK